MVGSKTEPVNLLGGEHASVKSINNWLTDQDPGFVDITNGNFSLKPDALVFKMIPGFEPIPFEKMGRIRKK